MIKLYSNENFDLNVVAILKEMGVDIISVREVGKDNLKIPDEQVLDYAIRLKRAVLTENKKDFIGLHKKYQKHCGIILGYPGLPIEQYAKNIYKGIHQYQPLDNKLIRIYKQGTRCDE